MVLPSSMRRTIQLRLNLLSTRSSITRSVDVFRECGADTSALASDRAQLQPNRVLRIHVYEFLTIVFAEDPNRRAIPPNEVVVPYSGEGGLIEVSVSLGPFTRFMYFRAYQAMSQPPQEIANHVLEVPMAYFLQGSTSNPILTMTLTRFFPNYLGTIGELARWFSPGQAVGPSNGIEWDQASEGVPLPMPYIEVGATGPYTYAVGVNAFVRITVGDSIGLAARGYETY